LKPWKFKKTDEYVETTDSIIKSKDGSLTNTSILSQDIDKELILKQITRDEFNDRVIYKRFKSDASCKIEDITSFVFGGFSSRFWLLRKHISSMEVSDLKNLPFYCWECLTIQTIHKNINIVVKNEKDMKMLLEFLIISLKSLDGSRGSAEKLMESQIKQFEKSAGAKLPFSEKIKLYNELYLKVAKRFNSLKVRMKISFMALLNK